MSPYVRMLFVKSQASASVSFCLWSVLRIAAVLISVIPQLSPAQEKPSGGVVRRVLDGDTIEVEGIGPVRLIGIDAPEAGNGRGPSEILSRQAVALLARESSAYAACVLLGKQVRLEFEGARSDLYGRTLAYVYLPNGTLVNAQLVRDGFASVDSRYAFGRLEEFRALERDARAERRGLWSGNLSAASVACGAAGTPNDPGDQRAGAGRAALAPTQLDPVAPAAEATTSSCCRVCRKGKPCGDSCIARDKTCRKPSGCAC